jgi:hypothetical protein
VSDLQLEGWGEYRKLILAEIERLSAAVNDVNRKLDAFRADDISGLKVDLAMLKVKAGVWGALGGLLSAIGAALIYVATK